MQAQMMPAAFLGHGSLMNAVERNRYTEAWRAFGASVPRPQDADQVDHRSWCERSVWLAASHRPHAASPINACYRSSLHGSDPTSRCDPRRL